MPHVGKMNRQTPWRNQYHVDPRVFTLGTILRIEDFHGVGDAPEPFQIDRLLQVLQLRTRLHLDERNQSAAFGDQIDLAARCTHPFVQDPPALQAQEAGGGLFGLSAPRLRILAGHFEKPVRAEPVEA